MYRWTLLWACSFTMARRLTREEGLLAGGSSGTAVAGAMKFVQGGGTGTVIVVLPDTGRSYVSKLYNESWLRSKGIG